MERSFDLSFEARRESVARAAMSSPPIDTRDTRVILRAA